VDKQTELEQAKKVSQSASSKLLDLRCMCDACENRTQDTYRLFVSCVNCGWNGIAILRKGDRPSTGKECPHCGCSYRLSFGTDPVFKQI